MRRFCTFFLFSICPLLKAQNVNEFNGAFNYDQALIMIPSNRGVPVNITASYQAGIQMNQSASEIGLGWSINAENAIYRSVSGTPDDTKSYNTRALPSGEVTTDGYGALYPVGSHDIKSVRRGLDTTEYRYPDFDSYYVSGSSISGRINPSYYNFYTYSFSGGKYAMSGFTARKPQFHFTGDFADTLVSRHYSVTPIDGSTPFRNPSTTVSGNGYSNSTESFIGRHLSGSTISNENFDLTTGQLATSNLVEYFTNSEINTAAYNGDYSLLGTEAIFIDYKSNHLRQNGEFPEDGIGYFRITGSNGLTYHYSLPVYELCTASYKVPLNNDYSLVSGLSTSDLSANPTYVNHPSNVNVYVQNKTYNKTAIKWLLVAITGPDFEDVNDDHLIDDGDKGYWVKYDYHKWSGNFVSRSPLYGFDYQYIPDQLTQQFPVYFPFAYAYLGAPYKLSGLFGSVELSHSEVYHLSKIKTPSHSALFVRDIRLDERSSDSAVTMSSGFKPTPDLMLKRILLFKNEQIDSLLSLYPKTSFSTGSYSDFSFAKVDNSANFFHTTWFSTNYSALYPFIQKRIDFSQDYSLCRKYHNNVNSRYDGSTMLTSPVGLSSNVSVSNYSSSGKLSLNGIYIYDWQNVKLVPSTQFDYNSDNSPGFSNPDYDPIKTDYWGFYKSDATSSGYSRYTTFDSKDLTKVWSMLKITSPMGATTEMEYESNTYQKVIDNEVSGGTRGAAFIYRIKNADGVSTSFDIDLEDGNGSSNLLSELPNFTPSNISGLKTKICLPFFHATCYNNASCVSYAGSTTHFKGFTFGECTSTLQTVSPGNPYNVLGNVILPGSNIRYCYTFNDEDFYTGGANVPCCTATSYDPLTIDGYSKAYSGNGFLMFETPPGYEVYGGGVRIKKLKTKNASNETYTTEYLYENGVATSEPGRFDYQVLKAGFLGSTLRYDFLQPKSYSLFDMAPGIGYSKVTARDLGRIGSANGKIVTSFITEPSYNNAQFSDNFKITTVASYATSNLKIINECVAVFPSIFGQVYDSKVYDKNNNIISKTTYEYTGTQQGALTECFHFEDLSYHGSCHLQTVNIFRSIPVVLKKTISYGMGTQTTTEPLYRDEITGETCAIRTTGVNNSSSISYRKPAYKYYQLQESIPFTSPRFRTILPLANNLYSYSNLDSTYTPTGGDGFSAKFAGASYRLYGKTIRQRLYNSTTGYFTTGQTTLPYYVNNRNFSFDAGSSSLNEFGVFNKTDLGANALNLSTINSSLFWEPSSSYNWRLTSENTLFDSYKNLVEVRDANNRFSAKRFGYKGYYQQSGVTNCNYASFTFADFETGPPNSNTATIDGDLIVNNHVFVHASSLVPHTGVYSLKVTNVAATFTTASEFSPNATLETGLMSGRIYRASVWVHNTNLNKAQLVVTIDGTINTPVPTSLNSVLTADASTKLVTTINNWNLFQIEFEIPEKFTTDTGTPLKIELKSSDNSAVYFDDFVLHPVESEFSATVYDARNGRVSAVIDANGLATNYYYDAIGRVSEVWKEIPGVGLKKVRKHTYNYARGANN